MFRIKQIINIPAKDGFARIMLMSLLFTFLVLYLYVSNKIIWVIYLLYLVLIIGARMKLTLKPIIIPLLVSAPLLWSLLMSYNSDLYHFSQGFFYLSIPLILILTGYQMSRIFTPEKYFSAIATMGILIALLFIIVTIIKVGFIAFASPYTEARFVVSGGSVLASGSPVCILSLVAAAYSEQFDIKIFKKPVARYLTILVNLTAIYLFASRTYWVLLFIFVIVFSFKTMRKDKLLFFGFLLVAAILILTAIINSKTGLNFQNSIFYKLVNSFKEIKVSDISNSENINTYYRGYEAYRSWITFTEGNLPQKIFGFGYGKLVNLDARVLLAGKYWTAVPWVHNGFFFILVKEGFLGVVFVLLFFYYLSSTSIKGFKADLPERQFLRLVLLSCTISMFITNYIVCGMFSHEMAILMITIGFLFARLSMTTI